MLVCANKTDSASSPTRLAVKNLTGGGTAIDISVKTADNSKTETFAGISNNGVSATREISFGSLTGVQISCTGGAGCTAGTLTLTANRDNTISVYSVASTTAPTLDATSSASGGGW
jgi:hypothetical protein